MTIDDKEFRECVYDLLCGQVDMQTHPVPLGYIVNSAFTDGAPCDILYDQMLDAYSRISPDQNDPDVEVIINNLLEIQRHIALKMFQYGVHFARLE